MNKKEAFRSVLIFGGAGFIGCNLAEWLLQSSDAKVHIFDNLSRSGARHNLAALEKLAKRSKRLQVTVADIRDADMVERSVRHATEIYHFAAQVAVTTSIADPRYDFDVNLLGTLNVLEAARKSANSPLLVFTSTNKVYGSATSGEVWPEATRYGSSNPNGTSESQPLDFHSPYGCSKGAADQYVRDYARVYGLKTVVLRMSCIAGPRQFGNEDQGWVAHFLYSALAGVPVTIYGNGLQVRDVLYVGDLIKVFEAVRQLPPSREGRVYNVGGGKTNTVSLLELAALIEHLTRHSLEVRFDEVRVGDQPVYITDFNKLQHDSGWEPETSVRETVERLYHWWKHNRELFAGVRATSVPSLTTTVPLPRTA
jgi:CDP-paratose 2-epimerase